MKRYLFALLHCCGLTRLAAWLNRRRTVILCYHGVTCRQEASPEDPAGLHVRAARFEAQLAYLARHYHVLSLREFLRARQERRPLPAYSVVLTFDDGYRNFLTVAAPRLRKHDFPATVFLIADRQRQEDEPTLSWSPLDDQQALSWAEARRLAGGTTFDFGSHTCSHPKLAQIDPAEAERELRASQERIGSELGAREMPFAFPYGSYTPDLCRVAESLGYSCALTTDPGANDDFTSLFALRRTLVGDFDDVPAFAARVSQLAAWLRPPSRGARA